MPLTADDAETNPTIPTSHLNYVRCLTDKHKQYTRFFDALLVPRPSHPAFFRDLKGFRCLPTTIRSLSVCDPDDTSVSKEQRKEHYRDVTRRFLGSRFAHPWCRRASAGMGTTKVGGWWGAEWAATGRRLSREQQEQEERLHKLLIPLWVCFRNRMFPGEAVINSWWEQRLLQPQADESANSFNTSQHNSDTETEAVHSYLPANPDDVASGSTLKDSASWNEDEDGEQVRREAGAAAAAATSLLRLAAASMIVSSMPKMQKWKLKRELKKQAR